MNGGVRASGFARARGREVLGGFLTLDSLGHVWVKLLCDQSADGQVSASSSSAADDGWMLHRGRGLALDTRDPPCIFLPCEFALRPRFTLIGQRPGLKVSHRRDMTR